MLFDTHTHLNADQFEGEEAEAVERAKAHDVTRMAVVGFDQKTIKKSLALSRDYDGIYSIIGWHPTESYAYTDQVEEKLMELLQQPKIVAMGEMGLDYHWPDSTKEEQFTAFRRQIRVAKELKLPITIHNREATEDVYQILKEEHIEDIGGIMHSFGEDTYWMERFLDLGMHISLSGVVTFKNAPEVREVAKAVPFDKLLIETDAPYLAPVPYRGKRNEPAYVKYVAEEVAKQRGISYEEVGQQTTANALRLFGIHQ
ncbi:TatD family hydrolase [Pisciglobus halotolerans]|uniref:TatD DNase family protein n=1 Tax=Pisciglobus halotolerans TaxID=745365 RepID=A0A1I3CYL6_9LACT|nr:TatD family hydrolase [Pisciglobus halotolerans]SFH79533.1 TatD DNase family protein [Pisciglobus halotolerans]